MKINLKYIIFLIFTSLSIYAAEEFVGKQKEPATSSALVVWTPQLAESPTFFYSNWSAEELASRIIVPDSTKKFIAKRFRPTTGSVLSLVPFQDNPYFYKVTFSNQHKINQTFYIWLTQHNFPIEATVHPTMRRDILAECSACIGEATGTPLGGYFAAESLESSIKKITKGLEEYDLLLTPENIKAYVEKMEPGYDFVHSKTIEKTEIIDGLSNWFLNLSEDAKDCIREIYNPTNSVSDIDDLISTIHPVSLYIDILNRMQQYTYKQGLDRGIEREFIQATGLPDALYCLETRSEKIPPAMFKKLETEILTENSFYFYDWRLKYLQQINTHFEKFKKSTAVWDAEKNEYHKGDEPIGKYSTITTGIRDAIWAPRYLKFIRDFRGSNDKPSFLMYVGSAHGYNLFRNLLAEPGHVDDTKRVHEISRYNAINGWVPIDVTPYMTDLETAASVSSAAGASSY